MNRNSSARPATAAEWLDRRRPLVHTLLASLLALVPVADALAVERPGELQVVVWNVESGDADPALVAERVAAFEGVDLWGFSEVADGSWLDAFERAAGIGEGSTFESVLGTTGGGDRLGIVWDTAELELLAHDELHEMSYEGRVRAPLVGHFRITASGEEFLFVVNHLYRSRAANRHEQASMLNAWGKRQRLPILLGGDMNFDWSIATNGAERDRGFDNLVRDDVFVWLRPQRIVKTQASTRYNSILDMLFTCGDGPWSDLECIIVVEPGDFPDDARKPDHRPVAVRMTVGPPGAPGAAPYRRPAAGEGETSAKDADADAKRAEAIEAAIDAIEMQMETLERIADELGQDDPRSQAARRRVLVRIGRMKAELDALRRELRAAIAAGRSGRGR